MGRRQRPVDPYGDRKAAFLAALEYGVSPIVNSNYARENEQEEGDDR
ncbi:MAG TPA: hypothetical protein VK045_11800 [Ornithinicoccus sp.]|jgi:hypothetical protein|nr:hypothetical protein [Ornithinicoccus sp.]